MTEKSLKIVGPVRTCIGCRQRAAAADLVRVVVAVDSGAPTLRVDRTAGMPGRGAWLHRDPECLRAAVRRRAFGPALRVSGLVMDADDLEHEILGAAQHDRARTTTDRSAAGE